MVKLLPCYVASFTQDCQLTLNTVLLIMKQLTLNTV